MEEHTHHRAGDAELTLAIQDVAKSVHDQERDNCDKTYVSKGSAGSFIMWLAIVLIGLAGSAVGYAINISSTMSSHEARIESLKSADIDMKVDFSDFKKELRQHHQELMDAIKKKAR